MERKHMEMKDKAALVAALRAGEAVPNDHYFERDKEGKWSMVVYLGASESNHPVFTKTTSSDSKQKILEFADKEIFSMTKYERAAHLEANNSTGKDRYPMPMTQQTFQKNVDDGTAIPMDHFIVHHGGNQFSITVFKGYVEGKPDTVTFTGPHDHVCELLNQMSYAEMAKKQGDLK